MADIELTQSDLTMLGMWGGGKGLQAAVICIIRDHLAAQEQAHREALVRQQDNHDKVWRAENDRANRLEEMNDRLAGKLVDESEAHKECDHIATGHHKRLRERAEKAEAALADLRGAIRESGA